jgi:hypothetical protein
VKRIRIVNNSNLPRSIMKERKILAAGEKKAKLFTGPTNPIPGPTLPSEVATAPKEVNKS